MRRLSRYGLVVALGALAALLFAAWLDTRRSPTYESPWGPVTVDATSPPRPAKK